MESCPLYLFGLLGLPLTGWQNLVLNVFATLRPELAVTIPFLSRLIGKRCLRKIKDIKSGACKRILPTSMRVRCAHSRADAEGLL